MARSIDTATVIRNGTGSTIDSDLIGDNTITGAKILDGAVDSNALGTGAIVARNIAPGAVDSNAIGTDAVTENAIKDAAITQNKIAPGVVTGLDSNAVQDLIPYKRIIKATKYNTSGNFSSNSEANGAVVFIQSGGGGGGGARTNRDGAAGGGGGAAGALAVLNKTELNASNTVTVGAAGLGGDGGGNAANSNPGTAGGQSSFGPSGSPYIIANGGGGGTDANDNGNVGSGNGGAGGNVTINSSGSALFSINGNSGDNGEFYDDTSTRPPGGTGPQQTSADTKSNLLFIASADSGATVGTINSALANFPAGSGGDGGPGVGINNALRDGLDGDAGICLVFEFK